MVKKARKRAKRKGTQRKSGTSAKPRAEKKRSAPAPSTPTATSGGGGVMQSMRSGFKRAAGVGEGPPQKESTLSKIIWGVLILAAAGYVVYKYTQ